MNHLEELTAEEKLQKLVEQRRKACAKYRSNNLDKFREYSKAHYNKNRDAILARIKKRNELKGQTNEIQWINV